MFRAFGAKSPTSGGKNDFVDVCTPFPRQGGPPEQIVPLGIRLKSTRLSHGRFCSSLHPPEARQIFILAGLSKKPVWGLKRPQFLFRPCGRTKTRCRTHKKQNQSRANRHENRGIPAMTPGTEERRKHPFTKRILQHPRRPTAEVRDFLNTTRVTTRDPPCTETRQHGSTRHEI